MVFRKVLTFTIRNSLVNLLLFVALITLTTNQCLSQESANYSVRNWLGALRSKDRFTRMNAAYESIDFDTDPQNSASILISALKHPEANVRRYAVNSLAEFPIKPESVVPVLVEALRDKDEQVREHAVIALAKLGSSAVPALVEALKQVSVSVDPSKLIGEYDQTDVRLSDLASIALWKSEAPIVSEMFNAYRKDVVLNHGLSDKQPHETFVDADYSLGGYIALIIGKRGESIVSEVIPFLKDENTAVSSLALNSIGRVGPAAQSAVPEVIPFLKDKNTAVRSLALDSLASIGPAAKLAIPEIVVIAKGTDKSLSQQAVSTLGSIGLPPIAVSINPSDQFSAVDLLRRSQLWLSPVQGLVISAMGILFFSKEPAPSENA